MAPMFQELINKWVNVNRSHYTGSGGFDRFSKSSSKHGEDRTAITATSSSMTTGTNPTLNSNVASSTKQASTMQSNQSISGSSRSRRRTSGMSAQSHGHQSYSGSNTSSRRSHPLGVTIQKGSPIRTPRVTSASMTMSVAQSGSNHSKRSLTSRKKDRTRSRLKKTLSQSDILKEKFDESKKKVLTPRHEHEHELEHESYDGVKPSTQGKSIGNRLADPPESVPINTGRFLNAATYSQQLHHQQQTHHHHGRSRRNSLETIDSASTCRKKEKRSSRARKHRDNVTQSHEPISAPLHRPIHPPFPQANHTPLYPQYSNPEHEAMAAFHQNRHILVQQQQQQQQQHPPSAASDTHDSCEFCLEMEKKIMMMQSDIEYLRSVAINEEGICSSCHFNPEGDRLSSASTIASSTQQHYNNSHGVSSSQSISSFSTLSQKKKMYNHSHNNGHSTNATVTTVGTSSASLSQSPAFIHNNVIGNKIRESTALMEASQRLVDVTARHQQQIEQMTRERSRWQNDMHLKLSKFALLCKELNEESAKRKHDYIVAQTELTEIKDQHSSLTMEVELLRAKVALHEQEASESEEIRESLVTRDNELMNKADDAIKKRDAMITDLSSKLEITMDTLELERYQQRQRRQIIFPVSRHQPIQSQDATTTTKSKENDGNSLIVKNLNEQLHQAQHTARVAEESLKETSKKAMEREEELQKKCHELAEELRHVQLGLSPTAGTGIALG